MKSKSSGFTLIEVLVVMVFFMICALGLLSFTTVMIKERKSIERRNFAYNMASDIAERLRLLHPSNSLIKPIGRHDSVCFAHKDGKVKECSNCGEDNSDCQCSDIDLWKLLDPLCSNGLYLYDANHNGKLDSDSEIQGGDTCGIDHPNESLLNALASIRPIRKSVDGTTYYAVWSVRYFPCGTNQRAKAAVSVYWLEPEPSGDMSSVLKGISDGTYRLKRVIVDTDITYGVI